MKVYTKKGDDGTTGILGGTRLQKHHLRIESYGTVDELNAFVGALRDQCADEQVKADLLRVQTSLFTIGSHLATDPEKNKFALPELPLDDITWMEQQMDSMETELPEMKNFVLPGGHPTVSAAHICRCVCRRAERLCSALSQQAPVSPEILKFLNRLSDYFFVLSRKLSQDLHVEEIPWIPRKTS